MQGTTELLARAVQLHQGGHLSEAAPLYHDVLARDAGNASALYLAGLLGLQLGETEEAGTLLARADSVRPGHAGTRAALAELRLRQGAVEVALEIADGILRDVPRHGPALFLRGTALARLGRPAEAALVLRTALGVSPDHADAHLNLANVLLDLDDLAGAERHARAAVALARPAATALTQRADTLGGLGHVLTRAGKWQEAAACCGEAIALQPNHAEAHWNRGIACFLSGKWLEGWAEYEWRKRHPRFAGDFRRLSGAEWRGEDLAGKRVLVLAEQGLGDALQFARYLPALRECGATPLLECAAPLVPLLSRLVPCVARGDELPEHDFWVDQMSLPHLFGTTAETVTLAEGYLEADPALVASWRRLLPPGRRIGLVWAGNSAHNNDRHRSLPPGLLSGLAPPPGACFIALQVGPRAQEAMDIPRLLDVSNLLTDWDQTAAAIACLDLLVTVDTSVAHCAGALGVPVWVMLPHVPDWRWLPGRDDTPWYRSMRLFRQPAEGAWQDVLDAVQAAWA